MICFVLPTVHVFQEGDTALHYAAYYEGHVPMVELLLERAPQLIGILGGVSIGVFQASLSNSMCVSE